MNGIRCDVEPKQGFEELLISFGNKSVYYMSRLAVTIRI